MLKGWGIGAALAACLATAGAAQAAPSPEDAARAKALLSRFADTAGYVGFADANTGTITTTPTLIDRIHGVCRADQLTIRVSPAGPSEVSEVFHRQLFALLDDPRATLFDPGAKTCDEVRIEAFLQVPDPDSAWTAPKIFEQLLEAAGDDKPVLVPAVCARGGMKAACPRRVDIHPLLRDRMISWIDKRDCPPSKHDLVCLSVSFTYDPTNDASYSDTVELSFRPPVGDRISVESVRVRRAPLLYLD